ncbi:MAG: site-2 protease family protein [Verrucomicrobiales bacterium]
MATPQQQPPGLDPEDLAAMEDKLAPVLVITGRHVEGEVPVFEGHLKVPPDEAIVRLKADLATDGRTLLLQEEAGDRVRAMLVPSLTTEPEESQTKWWLHGLLFFLTFLTTTWAGALHAGVNLLDEPSRFAVGLPYSVGLLLILGAHELGHYFTARHHGIPVSPPFFIPVPFALGTFGAFIKMKSLSPDRRAAFDVAIAGPLAGLVFAIPALIIGIQHSELVAGSATSQMAMHGGSVEVGSSVLMALLSKVALGSAIVEGNELVLHPLAFAGWLGLLVTALNLLPIGQLDGGHMAHALFGSRRGHSISVASLTALFLLAFFAWPGLMMWAIIVFFIAGTRDAPPLNDVTPVGMPRKLLGYAAFALLLAILLPVPHALYKGFGLYCPYL